MHAILFQLKKLNENQTAEENKWRAAADEISKSGKDIPSSSQNILCNYEGSLLILDGSATPALATAINSAAHRQLSYSLTFFEKATVWNYDPSQESPPPN